MLTTSRARCNRAELNARLLDWWRWITNPTTAVITSIVLAAVWVSSDHLPTPLLPSSGEFTPVTFGLIAAGWLVLFVLFSLVHRSLPARHRDLRVWGRRLVTLGQILVPLGVALLLVTPGQFNQTIGNHTYALPVHWVLPVLAGVGLLWLLARVKRGLSTPAEAVRAPRGAWLNPVDWPPSLKTNGTSSELAGGVAASADDPIVTGTDADAPSLGSTPTVEPARVAESELGREVISRAGVALDYERTHRRMMLAVPWYHIANRLLSSVESAWNEWPDRPAVIPQEGLHPTAIYQGTMEAIDAVNPFGTLGGGNYRQSAHNLHGNESWKAMHDQFGLWLSSAVSDLLGQPTPGIRDLIGERLEEGHRIREEAAGSVASQFFVSPWLSHAQQTLTGGAGEPADYPRSLAGTYVAMTAFLRYLQTYGSFYLTRRSSTAHATGDERS